jgi:aminoglycoside 6'-N-acetyltransferase I
MQVRPVTPADFDEWLRMRSALWPDCPAEHHQREMEEALDNPAALATFVAERPEGGLCGFLEASLRNYADGCDTSPVGYLEGWYVDPDWQRRGVGRALVAAAESWAAGKGCQEMASDCLLDNQASLAAHLALGYAEAERLIHFCKPLAPGESSTQ